MNAGNHPGCDEMIRHSVHTTDENSWIFCTVRPDQVVEFATKICSRVQSAEAFDFKGISGCPRFPGRCSTKGCSGDAHDCLNTGVQGVQ